MLRKDTRDGITGDDFLRKNDMTCNPGTSIFSETLQYSSLQSQEIFSPRAHAYLNDS